MSHDVKATIWSFHSQIQGVANSVAEMLSEAIGEQDTELLAILLPIRVVLKCIVQIPK